MKMDCLRHHLLVVLMVIFLEPSQQEVMEVLFSVSSWTWLIMCSLHSVLTERPGSQLPGTHRGGEKYHCFARQGECRLFPSETKLREEESTSEAGCSTVMLIQTQSVWKY